MSVVRKMTGAVAMAAAALTTVSPALGAKAQLLASSAAVVTGSVVIGGITVPLSPIVSESGNTAAGPYEGATTVASVGQTVYVPSASAPLLALSIGGSNLAASVVGSAQGTAFSGGTVSFSSVGVSLAPPAQGAQPYLTVDIANANGMSTYIPAGSAQGTAYGSTTLGSVVITGTLLKGHTITAPIDAPPNTVIYQAKGITVTVNAELAAKPLGCGNNCSTVPQGLQTDGVLVKLSNLVVNGQTISGSFAVGQTISQ